MAIFCQPLLPARAERTPSSLARVAQTVMARHFQPGLDPLSLASQFPVPDNLKKRKGVFVTLSKDGKPRACWGSVFAEQEDIVKGVVYATLGALTREYRYPPVVRREIGKLKVQVTVIDGIEPIRGLAGQNPLRDGLMVRRGGRSGVVLPGEARDAHYQLVKCRLKAGVAPAEAVQMYRLRAEIYD